MNIKQFLIEKLENTAIYEMAYNRTTFMLKVDSLSSQVIENWCLIHYCSLYDYKNINLNHWRRELYAVCSDIQAMRIDSNKEKAITQVFIKNLELNDKEAVIERVTNKFSKENITNIEKIFAIAKDFSEYGIFKLIYLLTIKNSQELYRYINEDI